MTGTPRRLLAPAAGLLLAALGCAGARPLAPPAPLVGGVAVLGERPAAGGRYAGSASCRRCHPGPWERWAATRHATALAGLPPERRGEAACLRCHATGFGDRFGYRPGAPGRGLDAVGCEACHGPGLDHAASRWPALVPPALGGACAGCEVSRVCRLCHTPERSPGFEPARDLERVSCAAPGPPRP